MKANRAPAIVGLLVAVLAGTAFPSLAPVASAQRPATGHAQRVTILDDDHRPVSGPLRVGESYFVEVELDAPAAPTVSLQWGTGQSSTVALQADPERSEARQRPVLLSDRITLGAGGLAVTDGQAFAVAVDGLVIRTSALAPRTTVHVFTSRDTATAPSPTLAANRPFWIEVRVPREQADALGNTLSVTLATDQAGASQRMMLTRQEGGRGRVRYTHPDAVTLSAGSAERHLGTTLLWDLSPVASANGDTLVVSYGDARTQLTVFDTPVQEALANYRKQFETARAIVSGDLAKPGLTRADQAALHDQLRAVANALALLDRDREVLAGGTERALSDYRKLRIAEEMARLLARDPRTWRPASGASLAAYHQRFGIVTGSADEAAAIDTALTNAQEDHQRAATTASWTVVVGVYQVVTNVTMVNQMHTVATGIDNMGRRVQPWERVRAATEIGTFAAGTAAGTLLRAQRGILVTEEFGVGGRVGDVVGQTARVVPEGVPVTPAARGVQAAPAAAATSLNDAPTIGRAGALADPAEASTMLNTFREPKALPAASGTGSRTKPLLDQMLDLSRPDREQHTRDGVAVFSGDPRYQALHDATLASPTGLTAGGITRLDSVGLAGLVRSWKSPEARAVADVAYDIVTTLRERHPQMALLDEFDVVRYTNLYASGARTPEQVAARAILMTGGELTAPMLADAAVVSPKQALFALVRAREAMPGASAAAGATKAGAVSGGAFPLVCEEPRGVTGQ